MAEKKIIWKQKTGESSYDILYPQTTADNVSYGEETVKDALDNIGTNLENKFVTIATQQIITGEKTFTKNAAFPSISLPVAGSAVAPYIVLSSGKITWTNIGAGGADLVLTIPQKAGTLLTDKDIPNVEVAVTGNGNAITAATVDTTNRHKITFTKGTTFASTATATQSANGLMSSTDKKNLDDMVTLFGTTAGDTDKVVNTVRELLAIFDQYPEGTTFAQALAGKVNTSDFDDYKEEAKQNFVTTVEEDPQRIFSTKVFADDCLAFGKSDGLGESYDNYYFAFTRAASESKLMNYVPVLKFVGSSDYGNDDYVIRFPENAGTLITENDLPESLPPTGDAGGDLTGTYPNPKIGTEKVTEAKIGASAVTESKIGAGAVTEGKIGANAVTTGKIKDGNVTNAKLDTTGVRAGSYSIVTVNAQGRATAGSQLFTIGPAAVIPSTVLTSAFYLQEVA